MEKRREKGSRQVFRVWDGVYQLFEEHSGILHVNESLLRLTLMSGAKTSNRCDSSTRIAAIVTRIT